MSPKLVVDRVQLVVLTNKLPILRQTVVSCLLLLTLSLQSPMLGQHSFEELLLDVEVLKID